MSEILTTAEKPRNGGFFARFARLPQRPDCLAGDAVVIGTISSQIPLLTGNFTGNFTNLSVQAAQRHQYRCKYSYLQANSLRNGTGNYFDDAGTLEVRTGIFRSHHRAFPYQQSSVVAAPIRRGAANNCSSRRAAASDRTRQRTCPCSTWISIRRR